LPGYDPFRDSDGYYFDLPTAMRYVEFIETHLTHIEGKVAGHPYILQEHEAAIVLNMFGWLAVGTGYRRYRECLYFVPRKNSKSTLIACIINAVMFCDPEVGMQNYSLGANLEQAKVVRRIANAQVHANPELLKRVKVYKTTASYELLKDHSIYRALTADAGTKHGLNAHFVAADEIHAYPNSELIDVLKTSMGARTSPMMIYTTTSDYERESACNTIHSYATKVRDGVISDPTFLPVIYEISAAEMEKDPDCWKDPAVWAKANPMLGKSVTVEFLQNQCSRALADPSYENVFKRLFLNIRTETSERMISSEKWDANDGMIDFRGREVVGAGLDIGSTSDMTSLCLLFDKEDGGFDAKWWHWIPKAKAMEYEQKYRFPFTAWEQDGVVELLPGDQIDYGVIRARLNEIQADFHIKNLAVDPLFQGVQLCQNLMEDNWNITYFKCNYMNMTAPTAEFLRFVNGGQFGHGDNPIMRWQASNAVLIRNATGCQRPGKAQSEGKIDGIVTAVMAVAMALQMRQTTGSIYETRGFLEFGRIDE